MPLRNIANKNKKILIYIYIIVIFKFYVVSYSIVQYTLYSKRMEIYMFQLGLKLITSTRDDV